MKKDGFGVEGNRFRTYISFVRIFYIMFWIRNESGILSSRERFLYS